MKRFFTYFLWVVGIGLFLYYGEDYRLGLQEKVAEEFNYFPLVLFDTFFPLLIGMLLKLPGLVKEISEQKPWGLDWVKLSAIGFPALFLLLLQLAHFTEYGASLLPLNQPILTRPDTLFITVASMVLGYILLDSLKKS